MEVRSAEIARRREEREQRKKDKEMERVAQLQYKEEERREAERKAREALATQRREERKVARQVRLLSHKCKSNIHCTCTILTRHYDPFVYKPPPPPLLFVWICCWGMFISNLCPPRPLRLRQMTGRLELTITPYIWSLATYWPAIHQPSDWLRGGKLVSSWSWCENCIAFSDRSHSAPSIILLSFALQNWATTSFIASHTRRWQTILPLLFPSRAPQWGKRVYKRD